MRADEGGHRGLQPAPSSASICSRDGSDASCLTCAASIAFPSSRPPFTAGLLLVLLREIGEDLRGRHRILRDDEAGRALETLADEAALVHRAKRQRVLDDDVFDARLARRRRSSVIRFTLSPVKSV